MSIVENLNIQHRTQQVKDSACSMCLDTFLGVNLEVSTSRAVANCYAREHMLWVTVIIHNYIDEINRGGLVEPSAFVSNVASHASQLFSFILNESALRKMFFGNNN